MNSKNKTNGRKNKNKNKSKNKSRNRQGVARVSYNTGERRSIPLYLRAKDDVLKIHIATAKNFVNRTVGLANWIIPLGFGTSGPGVLYLNDVADILFRLSSAYTHFMVCDLRIKVMMVTPYTSGGYAMVGYEPSSIETVFPPGSLTDVANSNNHVLVTPGAPDQIEFSPAAYFNDWRICATDSEPLSYAGVLQIFGANLEIVGSNALLIEFDFDVYFSGYRSG